MGWSRPKFLECDYPVSSLFKGDGTILVVFGLGTSKVGLRVDMWLL